MHALCIGSVVSLRMHTYIRMHILNTAMTSRDSNDVMSVTVRHCCLVSSGEQVPAFCVFCVFYAVAWLSMRAGIFQCMYVYRDVRMRATFVFFLHTSSYLHALKVRMHDAIRIYKHMLSNLIVHLHNPSAIMCKHRFTYVHFMTTCISFLRCTVHAFLFWNVYARRRKRFVCMRAVHGIFCGMYMNTYVRECVCNCRIDSLSLHASKSGIFLVYVCACLGLL